MALNPKPLNLCPLKPFYNIGANNLAERTASLKKNDRWVEKHLRRCAAVHMYFFVAFAAGLDFNEDRRKNAGYRGGRQKHIADEFGQSGMSAYGNSADAPDHRPAGIQVGYSDKQPPSPLMLSGNGCHHFLIKYFPRCLPKRIGICHGFAR